ncbi:MAG: metal ABC transporter solute-binding protein, Zn/Mn family [Acidimicrobiales bacterium]
MAPPLTRRRIYFALVASCLLVSVVVGVIVLGASSHGASVTGTGTSDVINAVGAENEYANVLSQIGGPYVKVTAILKNPTSDPHTFEASPSVATAVSRAQLVVQNGVGYDSFMNDIEAASPNSHRYVIVAQNVLGLPNTTPNPHLWYRPSTMPAVAKVMASDLGKLDPRHKSYFVHRLNVFDSSLKPWLRAIASFKEKYRGTRVAVTEPVADYLLEAMGMKILTPIVFQADVMNGVDPAPEDITQEDNLFLKHKVKVFCYNEQVIDSLTSSIRAVAKSAHVPIVGVYETMPTPGYDYQTWMQAEVRAIESAVAHAKSSVKL